MNVKIQNILISVIGSIVVISLMYLGLTIIFYANSGLEKIFIFKEAWYTTATFFAGLCTLGTGIVAVFLVNDWRQQHNKNIENAFAIQVVNSFDEFECLVFEMQMSPGRIKSYLNLIQSNDENTIPDKYKNSIANAAYCVENATLKFREFLKKINNKSVIMNVKLESQLKKQEFTSILNNIHDDIKHPIESDTLKLINYYEMLGLRYRLLCDKINEEIIEPILKDLREDNIKA